MAGIESEVSHSPFRNKCIRSSTSQYTGYYSHIPFLSKDSCLAFVDKVTFCKAKYGFYLIVTRPFLFLLPLLALRLRVGVLLILAYIQNINQSK